MSNKRRTSRQFPAAPATWDASSKETWSRLISVLESSELFDTGRRTRPYFYIPNVIVSVSTTLDPDTISLRDLAHVVAKLVQELGRGPYVDTN
jgi:hypothetical protein